MAETAWYRETSEYIEYLGKNRSKRSSKLEDLSQESMRFDGSSESEDSRESAVAYPNPEVSHGHGHRASFTRASSV